MKVKTARELLSKDVAPMSLESLQRHYVALLDAYRWSVRDYYSDADLVRSGFYVVVTCETPFLAPRDAWLSHNIRVRLDDVANRMNKILSSGGN